MTIPPRTTQLLELFHGPLRDVRFPDADGERLLAAVEVAQIAHDAVARAELAVETARTALAEKERAIAQETDRALAYARVYAADRPDLRAALDMVTATIGAGKPSRRGPGRPRTIAATAVIDPEAAAE